MIAGILPVAPAEQFDLDSTILVSQRLAVGGRAKKTAFDLLPPIDVKPTIYREKEQIGGYAIIEEISRGGMGVVYKAQQVRLGRTVALKTVLPVPHPAAATAQALRMEAKVTASFDHPGIIPVHDFGECEGRPYLCMTYVDGETLANRISRGRMPFEEVIRIMAEVAESIQYVHERGILHRDLKPANILVDGTGRSRLIDFGLARPISRESNFSLGPIVGTPSYMSPEQASGRTDLLAPASDVYSLGAVLYELLTGNPPFGSGKSHDVLRRVCSDDFKPPRIDLKQVPCELELICRRALCKSAGARYASAGEMARDLRDAS